MTPFDFSLFQPQSGGFRPSATIGYSLSASSSYTNEELSFDVYYLHDNHNPTNLIFYVHGGGLTKGDKRTGRVLYPYVASGDTILICVNYPLRAVDREILVEVQLEALRMAFCACLDLPLLSAITRSVVIGHSAGAYLLSLLFLTKSPSLPNPSLALFDCAAYDTVEKYESGDTRIKLRMASAFSLAPSSFSEELVRYSPVHIANQMHTLELNDWHMVAGKGLKSRTAAAQLTAALKNSGHSATMYLTGYAHNDPSIFFARDSTNRLIVEKLLRTA